MSSNFFKHFEGQKLLILSPSKEGFLKKVFLLILLLFILNILNFPVSAAVKGFLTLDASDKSYHQYDYEELIDSYAMKILGKPNGLYEDFSAKKTYALLCRHNCYHDYDAILNCYAESVLKGYKFDLSGHLKNKTSVKDQVPEFIYLVSALSGQLVRKGISTGETEKPDPNDHSNTGNNSDVQESGHPIVAEAGISMEQAVSWAKGKKANQRYIDIAALYWKYGEKTGISPAVLYAQAALETGYGRYMGQVPAEFNNWAGIKIATSNGDKPEDHQQFITPEDGVRGHFNHIAAYVGLDPVGEPHGRYHVVLRTSWAGTVKTVEELSGKWAPSDTYHERIINLLHEMAGKSSKQ